MSKEEYIIKSIPSSFVFNNMKLDGDNGSGESKLFVGNINAKSKDNLDFDSFFEFNNNYKYLFSKINLLE